mmetsp:Transcript_3428/g.12041  ORF Transcript_3428/g.12041 Transcript_3428/m.12041 type:complete len:204 (+) Transcript_3428:1719-2330(+)
MLLAPLLIVLLAEVHPVLPRRVQRHLLDELAVVSCKVHVLLLVLLQIVGHLREVFRVRGLHGCALGLGDEHSIGDENGVDLGLLILGILALEVAEADAQVEDHALLEGVLVLGVQVEVALLVLEAHAKAATRHELLHQRLVLRLHRRDRRLVDRRQRLTDLHRLQARRVHLHQQRVCCLLVIAGIDEEGPGHVRAVPAVADTD